MGRDHSNIEYFLSSDISIHSPRMGRDLYSSNVPTFLQNFNPLSPHGERLHHLLIFPSFHMISIHSPRMGRDIIPPNSEFILLISIHSPRMGRDYYSVNICTAESAFQSTLPAWGET